MTEAVTSEQEQPLPDDFSAFKALRRAEVESAEGDSEPAAETQDTSEAADEAARTEPESETGEREGQEKSEDAEPESEPEKKKGGFQRRIDKLTREKRELESRLQSIEQGQLAVKPAVEKPSQETAKPASGLPRIDDFETLEEYTAAITLYSETAAQNAAERAVNAAFDKQRKDAEEKSARDRQDQLAKSWSDKLNDARTRYEDFDEVIEEANVPEGPGRDSVMHFLMDSDKGGDLAYKLASDPKESARIAALQPIAAMRELVRIESEIEAKTPVKAKPRVSQAPEPIAPVGQRSGSTKRLDDVGEDMQEYRRLRQRGVGR